MMGMHRPKSCNRLTFKVAKQNENGLKIHFGDILLLSEKSNQNIQILILCENKTKQKTI